MRIDARTTASARRLAWIAALVGGSWLGIAPGAQAAQAEAGIVIELYRAIVHIEPHDAENTVVSSRLIDYDAYVESGLSAPTENMVRSEAPQIVLTETEHGIRIGSTPQRELIEVFVKAPRHTSSRIDINHHGEVFIRGMEAKVEVRVFKGRIQLRDVRRAVSVDVVRDANVVIDCAEVDAREPIYASAYDGAIQVLLPADADAQIDAKSHLGRVRSDFARTQPSQIGTLVLRSVRGDIEVVRKESQGKG